MTFLVCKFKDILRMMWRYIKTS